MIPDFLDSIFLPSKFIMIDQLEFGLFFRNFDSASPILASPISPFLKISRTLMPAVASSSRKSHAVTVIDSI